MHELLIMKLGMNVLFSIRSQESQCDSLSLVLTCCMLSQPQAFTGIMDSFGKGSQHHHEKGGGGTKIKKPCQGKEVAHCQ